MDDEHFVLKNTYAGRERVLLVVDGDSMNWQGTDWRAFRQVVHRACSRLHVSQPRLTTPVGEVTEAHFFDTLPRYREEHIDDYERRWNRREQALRDMGYQPHLYNFDHMGDAHVDYCDSYLKQVILERMASFHTLILVSSYDEFWPLVRQFDRECTRAFVVGKPNKKNPSPDDLRFVDLVSVQTVYSQTIWPRAKVLNASSRLHQVL